MANSAFSDHIPPVYDEGGGTGDLIDIPRRYLDMLSAQDNGCTEASQQQTPPDALVVEPIAPPCSAMPYTSGVVNNPKLNSSSTSYSSNDLAVDLDQENNTKSDDDDEEALKAKNRNPKKQWKPRFAFLTKTEVDYLDDGYKWRKYGQKAVKKHLFPRSYYRCASKSCGVKKTIERSLEDQSILVTTYVGNHTHPFPITRPKILPHIATYGGHSNCVSSSLPPPLYHQQPQEPSCNQIGSLNFNLTNTISTTFSSSYSHYLQGGRHCTSPLPSYVQTDEGLLQDMIIPFLVRKEEP